MIPDRDDWIRYAAGLIGLAWGGWWTYFGAASGVVEKMPLTGILLHAIVPGLVFLASAIVAWFLEPIGGILLLLESVFVFIGYPLTFGRRFPASVTVLVLLTMALPPLVSGTLYLLSWRHAGP